MDIHEAMKLAVQDYPNMMVFGVAENNMAWIFGLDFKDADSHPSEVGLPSIAVDKHDGTRHLLTPGTESFWKYRTKDTRPIPVPLAA
ncbi:hypothetical protein BLI708_08750 [Bifidobacterium imperatoris]|uniref:Immunity protein 35 domain-containing protein n=1 Tax=Bifidobacterium imperatoris TaxID=2020965 RepID=A0A2N5IQE9_9BIFI|nr:hypothetical protein [Bifidobacterium imperatoris]PLS24188.1 hypothetical protein Tam1G_1765 [Bifidobacterium imperatoris]QSY57317.1 hypothetical protein BLI708_08750 [Bifidobacterium imperatoris]